MRARIPASLPLPLDETVRRQLFPVCREQIFLAHAAVCTLPAPAAEIMSEYALRSASRPQEMAETLADFKHARAVCARFLRARPEEIALLGPTSLGLSLFANGLDWQPGDEVLCYQGDYPANVYPWVDLRRRGVIVRYLEPERPGEITPELVEASLTERTRLVALASCHFFTGFRLDVEAIGRRLHARGVLLSIDGIQSLGAFPFSVEHVDFLSADAHKWMLGPMAIGIVYVKKEHFERMRPTLLGAWNVQSPNFITQDEVRFVPTAQRYEPGVLNTVGIYGMIASLELLLSIGMERVGERLLQLKAHLLAELEPLGFQVLGVREGPHASGITTVGHPTADVPGLYAALEREKIFASLRHDRAGAAYLRFSPHVFNTEEELSAVAGVLRRLL